MKIKHFAGYGSVNATKVSKRTVQGLPWEQSEMTELVVKVSGFHEWGLERDDTYDIYNWLVKRFDKTVKDYTKISSIKMDSGYENGEETCTYTIKYAA